jgi:hypothetical protein
VRTYEGSGFKGSAAIRAGTLRVREAKHAIMVMPSSAGWHWELIDDDGATTASGLAEHQDAAMDLAWRAARRSSQSLGGAFPDIVVRHPGPHHRPD